jgi:hypothetical protein
MESILFYQVMKFFTYTDPYRTGETMKHYLKITTMCYCYKAFYNLYCNKRRQYHSLPLLLQLSIVILLHSNCIKQSPSSSSNQKIPHLFMEPNCLLLCPQKPAAVPWYELLFIICDSLKDLSKTKALCKIS